MRRIALTIGLIVLTGTLTAGVWAAATRTIVGTAKNDVLKGTRTADRIDGRAGNDTLSGLAGNDVLIGGKGNDRLVGGAGSDDLRCGPGRDVAIADPNDTVGADCETVKGLPSTPPPPPPPPPPQPQPQAKAGHYCGFTNQGKSICFDVTADSSAVANFATTSDVTCGNAEATFSLSFGSRTPIQPDLSFSFTYNGPLGSGDPDLKNVNTNYTVAGKLDTAGTATGTLTLKSLSFDYRGTHYDCGAAPYAWQVRAGA